jgi:hypothetical protein
MLRMNLLPIEQRKRVRTILYYQNVIFGGLFLIILIMLLILFLGAFLISLNLTYQTLEKEIVFEQSKVVGEETVEGIEIKVKELNQDLIDLRNIQLNQAGVYKIIENLYKNLFSGVQIHNLDIDGATKKVTVTGYSATRESLLVIKEALETSPEYRDVDFPLSNLVSAKEINFRFSFTFHED